MNYESLEIREIGGEEVNSVSLREVYLDLGHNEENFNTWSKRNLLKGFDEGTDYVLLFLQTKQKGSGGNNKKDYIITLDTAKNLAMMSKTPRGKEIRNYFIQVEKIAKNILGEKRIELELKEMEHAIEHKVEMFRQEEIVAKIGVAKVLQELGANFDPIALANGKFVTKLPKDIGEVLTDAMSDIRVGVRTFSATHLLSENSIDILTRDFNSAMMLAGLMEEYKYKGRTYRRFLNKFNWYGYNQDASSIKTNPSLVKYYEDRFSDLVNLLKNEGYID